MTTDTTTASTRDSQPAYQLRTSRCMNCQRLDLYRLYPGDTLRRTFYGPCDGCMVQDAQHNDQGAIEQTTLDRVQLAQVQTSQPQPPAAALAVVISPLDRDAPAGKRADAELHFLTGPLTGSRLIGFGIWSRRTGNGFNVTFPARTYRVNGDSRSFALLRPAAIGGDTHQGITDMILRAFEEWQERGQTRIDFTDQRAIMSVAGTKLEAPPLPPADRQVCLNPSLADLERADHMAGKHDTQPRQLCPVCRLDREGPAEPDEDARARNTMPGPLAQAAEIIRTNDRIDPGILIAAGLAQAAQDARQQPQPQAPKAPRARRF